MDELKSFRAADGATLRYRRWQPPDRADAPALVLLHGAASNGSRWWRFCETTRLAADQRLLRPDLRGHGGSVWRGPARMERWSDDLVELLDAEGPQQAILVGHCLGANLAAHCAARHPQRVRALVLVEPMLCEALLGKLAGLRPYAPLLRALILLIQAGNRLGLRRSRFPELDLKALDLSFAEALAHPDGAAQLKTRYASPRHDMKNLPMAQYLENLLQVLRPLPLEHIACPTLALLSCGRYMADPAITRRGLARVADLRVQDIDAEHWIPTEQPTAMREAIEAFVGSLVVPPRPCG